MSGEVRNVSVNSVRLIAKVSGDDENAALRAASEVLDRPPVEPRTDYISQWEARIVEEIWAHPTLPVEVKEELANRARLRAAEARGVEDRLRRTA
jgi:hypothetical protein